MKSSIKIDFLDRGTGKGLEPVIRVELKNTDDPRDKLISVLFESVAYQNFLQFYYSNHKHVPSTSGYPETEKTILLFKPEFDMEALIELVRNLFNEWAIKEGWSATHVELTGAKLYLKGDQSISDDELFSRFLSEKSTRRSQ